MSDRLRADRSLESGPAPIVLFAYNRPRHTLRTLESLRANPLASRSMLYVYADGPLPGASRRELGRIAQTREILRSRDWCGSVEIVENPVNKGLAASILDGVTEVVVRHGRVIVLEDDNVNSPGLLQYMNDALDLYEDEDDVMQVSSYLPIPALAPAGQCVETFFLRGHETCSGGWATWTRAWDRLDRDTRRLRSRLDDSDRIEEFTWNGSTSYLAQLDMNISGELETWAIKWHTTIFLAGGLCLYPRRSLVRNIGFDGSGVNSGFDFGFDPGELARSVRVGGIPLSEAAADRLAFAAFYRERDRRRRPGPLPWRLAKRCIPAPVKRLVWRARMARGTA